MNGSTAIGVSATIGYLSPLLVLVVAGLVLLLLDTASSRPHRRYFMWLTAGAAALSMFAAWEVWKALEPASGGAAVQVAPFGSMLVFDRFGTFMTFLVDLAVFFAALLSGDWLIEHDAEYGEYYPLLLLAGAGMLVLSWSNDLVTLFLGIEMMSLAVYVLTGSLRRGSRSAEAALKYFLVGAFASGFLLFGIVLVYGISGTTSLSALHRIAASTASEPLFLVGVLMLIVAFGFKVAAVPFHMWAPDAYEGAPTPVTGFMAAGVKAAAFAGVLRVFGFGLGDPSLVVGRLGWGSILAVIALLTMTLGNLVALWQENIKRLLAYSSIAHAGYLLLGVVALGVTGATEARSAILFYLLAYTFTTLGAFGVVAWIGARGDERLLVDDWSGLASRHPGAALAMTVFLLSLAGVPPTAGFFGKFYVFKAAMQSPELQWLVIAAVLNSVVSVYYYLKVITAMYFREPTRDTQPLRSMPTTVALFAMAVVVLIMGVLPSSPLAAAAKTFLGG